MPLQLPLPISLNQDFSFANFHAGSNLVLVNLLKNNSEKYLYFWGKTGSGRSHLLQACCQMNPHSFYLPLSQIENFSPEILDNLENFELICLDDLNFIAQNKLWETAVFNLYNKIVYTQDSKTRLIISANNSPKELKLQLPDLESRLLNGPVFQIQELTDSEKLLALKIKAQNKGLELPDEVGQFLLKNLPRNFADLLTSLEKLDQASLISQRPLTIPFVKKVFSL